MSKCYCYVYDVIIFNRVNNSKVHFIADSFSVDRYGSVRIQSVECGDITIQIGVNEGLRVEELELEEDDYDFIEQ